MTKRTSFISARTGSHVAVGVPNPLAADWEAVAGDWRKVEHDWLNRRTGMRLRPFDELRDAKHFWRRAVRGRLATLWAWLRNAQ